LVRDSNRFSGGGENLRVKESEGEKKNKKEVVSKPGFSEAGD